MLTKRIIPCLDVTDGRVVKGVNFVDLRDAGDPVECAKAYEQQGADELVFRYYASSDGRDTMLHIVERCAEQVFMPLTVGGHSYGGRCGGCLMQERIKYRLIPLRFITQTCWMNARVVLDHSVRYWRLMRVEKSMEDGKSLRMAAQPDRTECGAVGG